MKKNKLLFAAAMLFFSAGAWADDVYKNVTSTYLTNADFEGEYSVYSKPSDNRAIYQPNGWTVSYTNGDVNDMTALNSSCLQWSNFSGKAQLATGGNNTYWIRLRWGTGAILELSQNVLLPEGSYKLTADYYKNGTGGDGFILVNSTTKNASANENVWKSLSIDFTSDGISTTKIGCQAKHTAEYEKFLAFDNFVLEWNLTDALVSLISKATDAYNEDTSNTGLKDAIDSADAVKDSQDADELETAYNTLKSVAALAVNRKAWKAAKDAAEAAKNNDDYENVAGAELATLTAEIAKSEPNTAEGYESATTALTIATNAFTAAKDSYDAYTTAKASAEGVNEADVLAVVIAGNTNATAADALAASFILPKAYALKAATYAAPVVTDFVVNGTFDNSDISMWSCNTNFQNRGRKTTDDSNAGIMNNSKPWWENWNGSALVNKMSQTISNIPNGTYRLDITAFVNNFNAESQYVFANSNQTPLTANGGATYEVYTVVTSNQIEVGLEQTAATANWMGIDNVSLRYYGAGDVIAAAQMAAHKLAWDEAKAAAEAAVANTDYANVTGSEKTALEAEIAKAEPTTAEGYDDAAAALISATNDFIAAKTNYDALVTEITYAGTIGVSTTTAEAALNENATAATVLAATQNLKTLEYTSLNTAYPNDVTTSLLGTWEAGNYGTTSGQGYIGSETYFDKWNGSAMDLSSSKTVTLPAGNYVVRVAGRGVSTTTMNLSVKVGNADAISTPFLMAGDTGKGIDTSGATNFSDEGTYSNNNTGRGWQYRYITFTTDGTAEVVVAINGHLDGNTWQSFYAPVLLCDNTTAGSIYAGTTEYNALNSAISTAEAYTLGFENDQYAPYNNVAALEALATAKAIDQTAELTNLKTDVEAATTALSGATWTKNSGDVDAIYNGSFSSDVEGDWGLTAWTRTNAWGQQQTGLSGDFATAYYNQPGSLQYGNQGVYTMPLAANTTYKLTFSYRSHEKNSNTGVTVSVLNGEDGLTATTFASNGSTSNWVEATAYFTTGAAGNYVLTLANGGNTWMTGVSLEKSNVLEISENESLKPIVTTTNINITLNRTIKAGKWNTFCVPFDMTAAEITSQLGSDAKVKELTDASQNGENYTMTFSDASSIEAGKPYMVRVSSEVTSISLTDKTISSTLTPTIVNGVTFTGVYTNGYAPLNSFIISDNVFYNVDGENAVTLKAFRGYITVDSGSTVKALNFVFDDDATGIENLNVNDTLNEGAIYNLAGQRLGKMQKGINIVNGKKVLK